MTNPYSMINSLDISALALAGLASCSSKSLYKGTGVSTSYTAVSDTLMDFENSNIGALPQALVS
jgi:hypothetical protein